MSIPSPTVPPAGSPQSEKFRTLPVRMTTEFWARSVATILQSIADAALAAGVEIDGLVNDAAPVPPVSPPTSEPTGHTPGPWHSFQQADSTRHLVVAGDGRKPNEPVVATVSGYTATMHAAEAANARLIAAAPDLLAACKLIVLAHPLNGNSNCHECKASRAAEAAIAKAGGVA